MSKYFDFCKGIKWKFYLWWLLEELDLKSLNNLEIINKGTLIWRINDFATLHDFPIRNNKFVPISPTSPFTIESLMFFPIVSAFKQVDVRCEQTWVITLKTSEWSFTSHVALKLTNVILFLVFVEQINKLSHRGSCVRIEIKFKLNIGIGLEWVSMVS